MANISVTAANVIPGASAKINPGTAGATIVAGEAIFVDSTDSNKIKLCDANDSSAYVLAGIALNGASAGQPIDYVWSDNDLDIGATLVIGTVYIVDAATPGGVAPIADISAGDYCCIVGVADATDSLRVHIMANTRADTVKA